MSAEIQPALTPDEWADLARPAYAPGTLARDGYAMRLLPNRPLAFFAVANDALPDDDPRKITWAMVDEIRAAAEEFETSWPRGHRYLLRVATDVLAPYLPPR